VVTGAGGFLGGRLVNRLAAGDCRIVRVSRSALPPLGASPATVTDVCGDVSGRMVWDAVADADVIVHFAAQTSVAAAARDPDWDFRSNVLPMRHLLAACGARGRRPLVLFAGTVTQAGLPSHLPVDEDAADVPITVYDRHKLIAEDDLKAAVLQGIVRGASLRLANVYGPGAHGRSADRDVLNRMIRRAVDGQPLTLYGSGDHLRDYVFVEDVVEAFVRAAANAERINGRHFVVASGRGISVRDAFALIAARAERLTGRPVPVTAIEPPAPLSAIEQRHFVGDPARFTAATGWRPSCDLAEGIDRTIESFRCA